MTGVPSLLWSVCSGASGLVVASPFGFGSCAPASGFRAFTILVPPWMPSATRTRVRERTNRARPQVITLVPANKITGFGGPCAYLRGLLCLLCGLNRLIEHATANDMSVGNLISITSRPWKSNASGLLMDTHGLASPTDWGCTGSPTSACDAEMVSYCGESTAYLRQLQASCQVQRPGVPFRLSKRAHSLYPSKLKLQPIASKSAG